MLWNTFIALRSVCLAFVCLTISVVGTQAVPFDRDISGFERGLHMANADFEEELSGHIHAHHSVSKAERKTHAHTGHGDGCHTSLCCFMDYQQQLEHWFEETASPSPTQVTFVNTHSSRVPLGPDRPPKHS